MFTEYDKHRPSCQLVIHTMNNWLVFIKIFNHNTKYICTVLFYQRSHAHRTYWAPGSSPPLVFCRGHIPTAVPRMMSWILGISVGLVTDALPVVNRGAGCSSTLLFCRRSFFWVTESLVHWLVVVRADHLSGSSTHTTCHWTLCHGREKTKH